MHVANWFKAILLLIGIGYFIIELQCSPKKGYPPQKTLFYSIVNEDIVECYNVSVLQSGRRDPQTHLERLSWAWERGDISPHQRDQLIANV